MIVCQLEEVEQFVAHLWEVVSDDMCRLTRREAVSYAEHLERGAQHRGDDYGSGDSDGGPENDGATEWWEPSEMLAECCQEQQRHHDGGGAQRAAYQQVFVVLADERLDGVLQIWREVHDDENKLQKYENFYICSVLIFLFIFAVAK